MEVEQIMDEDESLPLTEENIETVLDEIRPYLVGEPVPSINFIYHLGAGIA